jgi:hypothetical protein
MYKISVIWRSTPQSFCKPPICLGIPPLFLEPLLTYLEIPPLAWCDSRLLRSLVGWILTPLLCSPFPFPPPPTVPHFQYMPFYGDITISTSHSLTHWVSTGMFPLSFWPPTPTLVTPVSPHVHTSQAIRRRHRHAGNLPCVWHRIECHRMMRFMTNVMSWWQIHWVSNVDMVWHCKLQKQYC